MKVSELIEQLQEYDPDIEIIVASDEEGNNFNRLAGAWVYKVREYPYEFNIMNQEDIDSGEYDPEDVEEAVDMVVIWP